MTLPFADQLAQVPEHDQSRRNSARRFVELGLPTPRLESWKYTNLSLLGSRVLNGSPVTASIPAPLVPDSYRLVFVDGRFDRTQSLMSLPEGVTVGDLGEARGLLGPEVTFPVLDTQPIVHLNTALCQSGLALIIGSGIVVDRPIEICFVGSGEASAHIRLWIKIGDNAKATIIERHAYEDSWTSTVVSEIIVGDGARLSHTRLNAGGADSVLLATGAVKLGRDADYNAFSLTSGGRLTRHQITAMLEQPGSIVHLNGAHILSGASHADTTTEIVHAAPHCRSRETYRHVMDGTSRSVFQGKIFVAEGAQKTDGFQLNQSLMLSPTAEVNAKPELEIYADDVKCSHGATSGRLDEDALFYLRSRGIPETLARQMLIEAFIGSSIDLIEDEDIRAAFRHHAGAVLGTSEEIAS